MTSYHLFVQGGSVCTSGTRCDSALISQATPSHALVQELQMTGMKRGYGWGGLDFSDFNIFCIFSVCARSPVFGCSQGFAHLRHKKTLCSTSKFWRPGPTCWISGEAVCNSWARTWWIDSHRLVSHMLFAFPKTWQLLLCSYGSEPKWTKRTAYHVFRSWRASITLFRSQNLTWKGASERVK